MSEALNSIEIIGVYDDIDEAFNFVYNRLMIVHIEKWMSIANIIDYALREWNYDCTLPGVSEGEVRGKLQQTLKSAYGKNINVKPFEKDGYLVFNLG